MSTTSRSSTTVRSTSRKEFAKPPGEFFFGNARLVTSNPLAYTAGVHDSFGDYIEYSAFFPPIELNWYQLTAPSAVEHVLQKHQNRYRKPDLFNKSTGLLTGKGILTSEGETWLRNRRLAQPAFHRGHIQNLASMMVRCCDDLLKKWEQLAEGTLVDLHKEMVGLTFNIASQALFSSDAGEHGAEFGEALRDAFQFINYKMNNYPFTPPMWMPSARKRKFLSSKALLDSVVLDIIERRRKTTANSNDFLSLLLNARDEETGEGMTDQQLKDEAITLLVAAHDTVAAALSWSIYLLCKNPQEDGNLYEENRSVLSGELPDVQRLENMPYNKAVFEEALRLYPPAWGQPRQALEDDEIDGYFIPSGAVISLSQWVTHKHKQFWEKPDQFVPERFLSDQPSNRPKFAYFPFGGGARVCIGQHMAMLEGQLVLAAIQSRFRFELTQEVVPDPTFTLIPKGLAVRLRRRPV